jgi:hypothetical protein
MANNLPVYNFPPTKFVEENALGDQLDHVMSEDLEVLEIVQEKYEDLEEACKDEDLLEEMVDKTQSLETFWRIMEKKHGQGYVRRLFAKVEEKCRVRGYYR